MHQFAWKRIAIVVALFALGAIEALYDWHQHSPILSLAGTATYMRNAPGDFSTVLWLYAIEASVAIVALQPWRRCPRRRWIGLGAASFGMWAAVRWLVGLHAPTVMLAHDVLMLVVAVLLASSVLIFGPESPAVQRRAQVT